MVQLEICEKIKFQKPFLKWIGGKTQIINDILHTFPEHMNNYHEIFLGGGSVLFALLTLQKEGKITIENKIYAYDINKTLINVYKHIQTQKDKLYRYLYTYTKNYDNIKGKVINRKPTSLKEAKTSKESYYYWLRDKYNKMKANSVKKSALFMFINKTCFRGVYREGPNGFNVPYGHYKTTPKIIDKEELTHISNLIKNVEFVCSDFRSSMESIEKGDFVYLDPPYALENDKSFVGYTKDGFDLKTHKILFDSIKKLECDFVMSNAHVELVTKSFEGYNIKYIITRRAIHSKNPESKTTEVIICKN